LVIGAPETHLMPSITRPPLVGFGTFNSYKDHEQIAEAVRHAIRAGYRHFDCASMYGNLCEIGAAFAAAIKAGEVRRDELYVVSKLWCADAAPDDVKDALTSTLTDLRLDYLDNYTMHWPSRMDKGTATFTPDNSAAAGGKHQFDLVHQGDRREIAATYAAMETLVDAGLVRSLGVSNFNVRLLGDLLQDCRIRPETNQFELQPYLAQRELVAFCDKMDVHVVAYSPLGKPGYTRPADPELLADPVLAKIAEEVGKTPAHVALRWAVQRGASVIPKSCTPVRILANRDVLEWSLTPSQMERIESLDCGYRYVRVDWFDFDSKPASNVNTPPPGQALIKAGTVDELGLYRNSFGREGRELRTEVIIRRGLLEPDELARNGRHYIPEKCWQAPLHLVTDETVDTIYGAQVVEGLAAAGFVVHKVVLKSDTDDSGETSTEHSKTMASLQACADAILEKGITKHSAIVSLGGGVVNNLAGLLASMLYRGITLVHLPTTTMSAFDAALDFKQAVNHQLGKNLLGSYYPASTIAIDPDVLATLSERHSLNGVAEALKHGLTQSTDLTDMIVRPLREGDRAAVIKDGAYMEALCKAALEIKAPTLDDYESSDYNEYCPQYGHAVGHAVEHTSWSGGPHAPLLHGEAVAIGMCVSAEVALVKGVCTEAVVREHYDLIGATGLPTFVPLTMAIAPLIRQMRFDKHTVKNPTMGLCAQIGGMALSPDGESYAFTASEEELLQAFTANMAKRDAGVICGACASVFAAPMPAATK
jgi:diketogulonate reductase-like aldo/keto reductase/3-dehydroquinate synthetase